MQYQDFIKLVKEMREAQKAYFKAAHSTNAKAEALKRSKSLEREVDLAVIGFEEDTKPKSVQASLFE